MVSCPRRSRDILGLYYNPGEFPFPFSDSHMLAKKMDIRQPDFLQGCNSGTGLQTPDFPPSAKQKAGLFLGLPFVLPL
jgi:hypothetical protein